MSTSAYEWFKPPLPQDRAIGPTENWKEAAEAAIGLLAVAAFISVVVGASFLFVAGATHLNSLIGFTDLPFLGQFLNS
jgi:hypothetical protein